MYPKEIIAEVEDAPVLDVKKAALAFSGGLDNLAGVGTMSCQCWRHLVGP